VPEGNRYNIDRLLVIAAIVVVITGCYVVVRPFFVGIVWSIILAYSTWGGYKRLNTTLVRNRTAASLVMSLTTIFVLLVPFSFVIGGIAQDSADLITEIRSVLDQGLPDPPGWLKNIPFLGSWANEYWLSIAHDGQALIREGKGFLPEIRSALLNVGEFVSVGVGQLSIGIFLAFFIYRDGDRIYEYLHSVGSKLLGDRAQKLLSLVGETITGVVYGVVGTALAQGLIAGVGFMIAGVPAAALLGLVTFFISFIPMAPPLVWLPVVAWLYWNEGLGVAAFMFVWGMFAISGIDNVIKPWLISRGAQLPFDVVFLGIAGGVLGFGFIGVFIGPILLAVGLNLLRAWVLRG